MADLVDIHGNPVQLTDEHGNPVQLTDEHGKPMQLTGVATAEGAEEVPGVTSVYVEETHVVSGPGIGVVSGAQLDPLVTEIVGAQDVGIGTAGHQLKDQPHRSSSSSSSEDDGQGGRRKKGIKQKLKETFGVGRHKHGQEHTPPEVGGGATQATPPVGEQQHYHEHEKKSMMEKIKEKLPGHHHTSQGK